MDSQQLRNIILKELPQLMQSDSTFREAILEISRSQFADKLETEERFNHLMARQDRAMEKWDEHNKTLAKLTTTVNQLSTTVNQLTTTVAQLATTVENLSQRVGKLEQKLDQKIEEDRQKWKENDKRWEENDKRWDENDKRWDENDKRWEENNKRWDENNKRWDENNKRWDENNKRWDENNKRWDENDKHWEENQRQLEKMTAKIDTVFSKVDQRMGAIGARWGINSEASFRNALAGILADFPDVQVLHTNESDEQGVVFGYPEQIELDLIIKNGVLIIGELKSNVEKLHIAIFEKKVRFYEQKHGKSATRKIVISPMVEEKAMSLAQQLGIEVYTYAQDVDL